MGFLSGFLKLGLDVVTLPISVAKSVVDDKAIHKKVDNIDDDIDEMFEDF